MWRGRWVFIFALLTLTSCAPSDGAIQTAISRTETAHPTDTVEPSVTNTPRPSDTPAPTSTPVPTNTTTPQPIPYDELLFHDPTTWPLEYKENFLIDDNFSYDKYNELLLNMWAEKLQLDEKSMELLSPLDLMKLVIEYCQKEGKFEAAVPTIWRDTIISSEKNQPKILYPDQFHLGFKITGEYAPGFIDNVKGLQPPREYLISTNPLDWGKYKAEAGYVYYYENENFKSYIEIKSFDGSTINFYSSLARMPIVGKLVLLTYLPGVFSNQAEEAIVLLTNERYAVRRIQYQPQEIPDTNLFYCESGIYQSPVALCKDTKNIGELILPTRIIQWNLPPESKIDATHEIIQALWTEYPTFLQVRIYGSGYYVAGAPVGWEVIVPNLPGDLAPSP